MLAAARSTSCHAGRKPTGYVPLMDKKGEKGGKKRGTGSESAGCVDQRNRKNSGNADFAPQVRMRERPKIRIERKARVLPGTVQTAQKKGGKKRPKTTKILASGPPRAPDLKPELRGKNPEQ